MTWPGHGSTKRTQQRPRRRIIFVSDNIKVKVLVDWVRIERARVENGGRTWR
jgi:hypothetical protein